jgi:hypothetical protein
MKMATALATLTVLMTPAIASAQASDSERHDTFPWRPDLIAAYESEGGQNVPNFKFDGPYGTHSAGGVCQMLTSTYLGVAPTIDIDVVKFPVLGTLDKFTQWRVCWKLWSLRGYEPWTCSGCNSKLRKVLESHGIEHARHEGRHEAARAVATTSGKSPEPQTRIEWYSARLAASSDVYHAEFRASADDTHGTGAAGR